MFTVYFRNEYSLWLKINNHDDDDAGGLVVVMMMLMTTTVTIMMMMTMTTVIMMLMTTHAMMVIIVMTTTMMRNDDDDFDDGFFHKTHQQNPGKLFFGQLCSVKANELRLTHGFQHLIAGFSRKITCFRNEVLKPQTRR